MKVKLYFNNLKKTFINPDYYLDIIKKSAFSSFLFFALTLFLLGIIQTLKISYLQLPGWQKEILAIKQEVIENYPVDLTINWNLQNQLLTISPSTEVEIYYPSRLEKTNFRQSHQLALISNAELNQEKLNSLSTSYLFVVNKNLLHLNNQGFWQNIELMFLPGFNQDFRIDQNNIEVITDQIATVILDLLKLIKTWGLILIPLWLIINHLWLSLMNSLLIFLLVKSSQLKLNFKNCWQWSLHILIVAETISQLTKLIYHQLSIPMLTLSFWLIFLYLILSLRNKLTNRL